MGQLQADIRQLEQRMDALRQQTESERAHVAGAAGIQLDRLTDLLIGKKLQLSQLQGDVRCPFCQMINPKTNRACTYCGQAMDNNKEDSKKDNRKDSRKDT